MIKSRVKSFECYGEGWLFHYNTKTYEDTNIKVDLDKLAWKDGYTLSFQGFGVLDPIFGGAEAENPWFYDTYFIMYLLRLHKKVDDFIESMKDIAQDENIKPTVENLEAIVNLAIDNDPDSYIKDFFSALQICNDNAVCGITDEEYFVDCLNKLGIDIENDDEVMIVAL